MEENLRYRPIESTIVDLTNSPKILRLGGLEISKIEKTLGIEN